MKSVGVIGGGAWGTALAIVAVRAGLDTLLWAHEAETIAAINEHHENRGFLPGVPLDSALRATDDFAMLADLDFLLLVCPAQHLRATSRALSDYIPTDRPVVICAKGIEQESGSLMSDVLAETMPVNPIAILSGPTFAIEVARGAPSAVTLACESDVIGEQIVRAIGQATFRPYWSDDIIGAQIGGAVKNVLAIASGIVAGKKLGRNARAALITRGMAEMIRFGLAKGAEKETLMGLSGLGDLILTCSSTTSRNMSLGKAIGEGAPLHEILGSRNSVSEGVYTASVVHKIATDLGIDLPISSAVHHILNEGADVGNVIEILLNRPFTKETL